MDIKSAFLQGKVLDREVFLTPPGEVFLAPPREAHVSKGKTWKLVRCLYGLNDVSRQLFESVAETLKILGCQ